MTFYPGPLDELGTIYTDEPPAHLHRWFVRAFTKQYLHGPWGWMLEQSFVLPSGGCSLFTFDILQPGSLFAAANTSLFGIAHVLSGSFSWGTDDPRRAMHPADGCHAIYLPAGLRHPVHVTKGPHQLWVVQWDPGFLRQRRLFPELLEWSQKNPALFLALQNSLTYRWDTVLPPIANDPDPTLWLEARLLDALRIYHCVPETELHSVESRLRQARDYMDQHLHERLTIRLLARQVSLNESMLKAGFKAMYATTIHDYLYQQRMQRAMHLLQTTHRLIQDIADACGYRYASHFARMFYRKFGKRPQDVRKTV